MYSGYTLCKVHPCGVRVLRALDPLSDVTTNRSSI